MQEFLLGFVVVGSVGMVMSARVLISEFNDSVFLGRERWLTVICGVIFIAWWAAALSLLFNA